MICLHEDSSTLECDLDDYFVLQKEGWKLPNSNTLRRYKKEELVGIIRMLEHNWSGAIKQNMLQNLNHYGTF